MTKLTTGQLRQIMIEAGGLPETTTDNDLLQASFHDLDFDSIARIEVVARVQEAIGLHVPDEAEQAATPAELLGIVNRRVEV